MVYSMITVERNFKETAREYALRTLKENIVNLNLEPGSLIKENEIAELLGVSRTPVREALMELSRIKIVEIYPQKGSYVAKIDFEQVEEARFLRVALEKAIVELVCKVAGEADLTSLKGNIDLQEFYLSHALRQQLHEQDDAFHKMLFTIPNRLQTYDVMSGMMLHFDRVRKMGIDTIKDIKIVEDHKAILEAIQSRNGSQAREEMEKHLYRMKFDCDEVRQQYPLHYFQSNPL